MLVHAFVSILGLYPVPVPGMGHCPVAPAPFGSCLIYLFMLFIYVEHPIKLFKKKEWSNQRPWPHYSIRHFGSTANSKVRWRKNVRMREIIVYLTKLSGFKRFRIQSSHLKTRFRLEEIFPIRECFQIISNRRGLHWKDIWTPIPFTYDDNSGNIHDEMVNYSNFVLPQTEKFAGG